MILKKENGLVTVTELNDVEEQKMNETCHLCWENCANALPNVCPKVTDRKKHTIDAYDFITDGYQTFDDKGEVDTFIVSKCDNYQKSIRKEKTKEEAEKLRKIKECLRMAYFEADSLEDAYIIQYELEKRGALKNIKGRRPKEEDLIRMKARRR